MNAKFDNEFELAPPLQSPALARAKSNRWLAIGVIAAIVAAGLLMAVWQQVRDHVLAGSAYLVDPQQIAITPPPPWIRADVHDIRAEVLREASLDGPLSLMDSELTVRIAAAFAAHPWVARVSRVSKQYPSSVEVELEYRRPVAFVEVPNGLYPIDVEGVLLPPADFPEAEAAKYPWLSHIHSAAPKQIGTRWEDPAVVDGAQIANLLADDWQALRLRHIELAGRKPTRGGAEYVFNLLTIGGTRVLWGRAPGGDLVGELPAGDKLVELRAWAAHHGSLDRPDAPQELEFQENGALARRPRPRLSALPTDEQ